ncbi:MAG: SigE family RNA polymerase sigma factor [Jiangellaceae bacterium]|nr:SigE family RNA polymerase sigma factor [Jiangellaceae bacterium]
MTVACPASIGAPAVCGTAPVPWSEGWAVSTGTGATSFSSEADQMVTELFTVHYAGLVRLATLLLRDQSIAEEAVQDAFVALHRRWRKLRDPSAAVAYLRTSVIHNTRSIQRRRAVAARHPEDAPFEAPSAEYGALRSAAGEAVIEALRQLPARQRETLMLRYYADLSEAEIAEAMKISRGAVKSHASRGMAALRSYLEQWA